MLDFLSEVGVPTIVVFTKIDKLSTGAAKQTRTRRAARRDSVSTRIR